MQLVAGVVACLIGVDHGQCRRERVLRHSHAKPAWGRANVMDTVVGAPGGARTGGIEAGQGRVA